MMQVDKLKSENKDLQQRVTQLEAENAAKEGEKVSFHNFEAYLSKSFR